MGLPKIIIAIDGFSSCGKSTLARDLSKRLSYTYVDTGAMYRAVTLYFLRNNIDLENLKEVSHALSKISIHFAYDDYGKQLTFLNDELVEDEIRKMEITRSVSNVSSIKAVRKAMVDLQRKMGNYKGLIMDGRDIGTVVFPSAELKIFMKANYDIRAQRRYAELIEKNVEVSMEEVLANLKERDYLDTHRTESPLKKASDALVLDNSELTMEEQLDWAFHKAIEKIFNSRK